ncbi:MAG: class I mannose-6-phosphate isomerase [Clostridia bacterium]
MNEYGGVWKLTPYLKEKIWAGKRLDRRYGGFQTGEAYLLSDREEAPCTLEDGTLFSAFLSRLGYGNRRLSLLVKAIDAAEPLSLQVHPAKDGKEKGKDELWLIDHVYADAEVYIGFRPGVSEKLCRRRCEEGNLLSLMNPVPVSEGDVLFIPGGTVHGAGGVAFYEIQHNCDVTFRLEDYGRGRELRREEAFSVMNFSEKELVRGVLGPCPLFPAGSGVSFDPEPIAFRGGFCRKEREPGAYLILDGSGFCNGEPFSAGDCFFAGEGARSLWEGHGYILCLKELF